jgi:hypothetical protein
VALTMAMLMRALTYSQISEQGGFLLLREQSGCLLLIVVDHHSRLFSSLDNRKESIASAPKLEKKEDLVSTGAGASYLNHLAPKTPSPPSTIDKGKERVVYSSDQSFFECKSFGYKLPLAHL